MQLTLKLLGGLQITWDVPPHSPIATGKTAALLCYLAVTGRPHARASLASLLWGEMSDSEARNNLRVTLSNLRRDCADHLIITRETIAFNTDAAYLLDVEQFLSALQQARSTMPPDLDALRTAVDIYQGEFLQGFAVHDAPDFDEWVAGQRDRLHQLAVQAQHDLATGTPGPQTSAPATAPAVSAEPAPPRNRLPAYPTAMVGREAESAQVTELLGQPSCRLVTLYGAGGIGKTRLALAVASDVAARFADGAAFVPLGTIVDHVLVAGAIAQVLEVRETAGRPLREQLMTYLQEKQMLLVLDNFEQVTAAAPLVADLLASCARLKIIVTSRELLRLRGEHEVVVPPLPVPAGNAARVAEYGAVALFVDRAQAVQPRFQLTAENAATVVGICARLDGLPLAIELAAARSRMLSPQALLSRLGSRLTLWASGTRDTPERQRTLRDTIRWSYELLEPDEQTLFARLGGFVGGFTLATAEAVCELPESGPPMFVLDLLESLVGKSLIWQQDGVDGEPRFGMLEMIREYAQECLEASGEAEAIRRRHAQVFMELAEAAEPELGGSAQVLWLDRLEAEHENLRAALRWGLEQGDDELALRLGGALMHFWYMHGHYAEGRRWLQAALQIYRPQTPLAVRAKALNSAGFLAYYQSDTEEARSLLSEALAAGRQAGDAEQIANALQNLATVLQYQDDYAHAKEMHEESVRLFRSIGNTPGVALGLYRLGNIAETSNTRAASALYQESLGLFRTAGDKGGSAAALMSLGLLHQQHHEYDQAMPYFMEALELNRALRNPLGTAWATNHMAYVALHQGDYQRAAELFTEGQTLSRTLGNKAGIASGYLWLGHVARKQGDAAAAEQSFMTALELFLPLDPKYVVASLDGLALVAADRVVTQRGDSPDHSLTSTASAARAAQLWGVADAMRESINAPLPVDERDETEPLIAIVRAALGPEAFDAAWQEGRSMTPEQLVHHTRVTTAVAKAA